MAKKLVYGVGINDADYVVQPLINGKQVECLYYRAWKCMLMRCYSDNFQKKNPTYIGCSVCDEWLRFSNFKQWLECKGWSGQQIDKDLIFDGNKLYSPQTCCLVDNMTNCFFLDRAGFDSRCSLVGVYIRKKDGKYIARCRNPFSNKNDFLGSFNSEIDAHNAWKSRKNQHAIALASAQEDGRVSKRLLEKYAP